MFARDLLLFRVLGGSNADESLNQFLSERSQFNVSTALGGSVVEMRPSFAAIDSD
jgi:hypothetical protein